MTQHLCDSEFSWRPPHARTGDFTRLRVKGLSPARFAVGRAEIEERGVLVVTNDGKEVLEEILFLASSPEVRSLPGFRGSMT